MVKQCDTKEEFDQELKNAGDRLVVIDFTATWCGPCRMIGPKFVAMASEFTDVVFLKVDVDENTDVAEECGISAMPTFKCFKNGKQVAEIVGASEEKLRKMITENR